MFWAKKLRKIGFFEVFRHYFRKTLHKLAVLLRLSSNLQGSRLFDCKGCANNKIDQFSWKKIMFWAKKRRKNGFFVVFRHYFRKTLAKLAVLLRLSSNLQGIRLFDCKRCANSKIDHFRWKKFRFWAKNLLKNGFFQVFRHYFRKTLRKHAVLLRLSSNLQDIRLFVCKRCANNKIDHFTWTKIRFLAKKRRKNGFFVVFRHYFRKTLPKLAVLLRLSSNLQDSRVFDCKSCADNKMDNFNRRKK